MQVMEDMFDQDVFWLMMDGSEIGSITRTGHQWVLRMMINQWQRATSKHPSVAEAVTCANELIRGGI